MQKNLKVIHYNNGDLIQTTIQETLDLTDSLHSKFQWSTNNFDTINVDGLLYTWYVIDDKRKICPTGWHVPSDSDYCILENYLEPGIDSQCNKIGHRGSEIGNLLKEEGHKNWLDPETGANNKSGFTAIPNVIRTFNGEFRYSGLYAYFWTSSEFDSKQAWSRRLYHDSKDIVRGYYFKKDALSVRCIKD